MGCRERLFGAMSALLDIWALKATDSVFCGPVPERTVFPGSAAERWSKSYPSSALGDGASYVHQSVDP